MSFDPKTNTTPWSILAQPQRQALLCEPKLQSWNYITRRWHTLTKANLDYLLPLLRNDASSIQEMVLQSLDVDVPWELIPGNFQGLQFCGEEVHFYDKNQNRIEVPLSVLHPRFKELPLGRYFAR